MSEDLKTETKKHPSRKKIILLVVVILLLIDIGLFVAWHFNRKKVSVNKSELLEYSDVELNSWLSENEEEVIKDNVFVAKIGDASAAEVSHFDINMIRYYGCMARKHKDAQYGDLARDYIDQLVDASEEERNLYRDILELKLNGNFQNSLNYIVSRGNADEWCTEEGKLESKCLISGLDRTEQHKLFCGEICNYIKYGQENKEFFKEAILRPNILTNIGIMDSGDLTYDKQSIPVDWLFVYRIAIAYRIGGEDAAHKICENGLYEFNNFDNCENKISGMIQLFKTEVEQNCQRYKDGAINVITR